MHYENAEPVVVSYCGVLGQAKDVECKTIVDKGLKFSKAVPF